MSLIEQAVFIVVIIILAVILYFILYFLFLITCQSPEESLEAFEKMIDEVVKIKIDK